MSLVSDALTYARNITQSDSNGLTDSVGLTFANDGLQNITRAMFKRDINAAQIAYFYTNIVGGQGQYAWPANMYSLKTIEVNYQDTNQQNFRQPSKLDVANLQGETSFDFLRVNQPTQSPMFTNYGDTFELFPTPGSSITNGIQIAAFITPTEFATTSATIPYPLSLDFRCLACRIGSLFANSLEKYDLATSLDKEYARRLEDIIEILAPQSQQPVESQSLQITGFEF